MSEANINDLNIEEKTKLEEILAMHPTARSEADNAHLDARKAYLPKGSREAKDVSKMNLEELQEQCTLLGLPTEGTEAELKKLIGEAMKAEAKFKEDEAKAAAKAAKDAAKNA